MICMELTRTDDVFSRTTVCCFLCTNECSPNTAKLFDVFYGPEKSHWARAAPGGCPEGGTTHLGAPRPPCAPWWVVPTSVASRTPSSPYKFPIFQKPSG